MDGADTLIGNGGTDVLKGGMGADAMIGGAGDDLYYVDDALDTVTETTGAGNDTVSSSIDYTLTANVERLNLTGSAVNGTGNDLINVLVGTSGANRLDGLGGSDSLFGGAGDDTYVVDVPGDAVFENAGEGTDTVLAGLSYTLAANVENLQIIAGAGDAAGTGNGLANMLTGNDGSNELRGQDGNDTIDGGGGNDRITGGTGADILRGGAGNDGFYFDTASDIVIGEQLDGGTGFDTVFATYQGNQDFSAASLTGIEGADSGTGNMMLTAAQLDQLAAVTGRFIITTGGAVSMNGVTAAADFTLSAAGNAFDLTGVIGGGYLATGAGGNDRITGSASADTLLGNGSADVLIGGLGADVLNGGSGTDMVSYEDNHGGVFVNLTLNQGFGNAAAGDTYVGIEDVRGSMFDDTIIGNGGANRLEGGDGNDVLRGAFGADTLVGGNGLDTASYEDNQGPVFVNLLTGQGFNNAAQGDSFDGIENLTGSIYNDYFIGTNGANTLNGGDANDILLGALGADSAHRRGGHRYREL